MLYDIFNLHTIRIKYVINKFNGYILLELKLGSTAQRRLNIQHKFTVDLQNFQGD